MEVEPISGIAKSPNREEKIKRNHKSLDRHTPLPLPENLIRSSEQRYARIGVTLVVPRYSIVRK